MPEQVNTRQCAECGEVKGADDMLFDVCKDCFQRMEQEVNEDTHDGAVEVCPWCNPEE